MVKVEKIVEDKEAKIIYIKVAAPDLSGVQSGQFKIISFGDKPNAGDDVFVFSRGSWTPATLGERGTGLAGAAHLDSLGAMQLVVVGDVDAGSLVVTSDGKMVGFVTSNKILIPADAIARVVGGVLVVGSVMYDSLGVDGWFGVEAPIVVSGQVRNGFLVNKSRDKASKLKRGDVVLEINGVLVTPEAWQGALAGASMARVKVFRQGEEIALETPVVKIGK